MLMMGWTATRIGVLAGLSSLCASASFAFVAGEVGDRTRLVVGASRGRSWQPTAVTRR